MQFLLAASYSIDAAYWKQQHQQQGHGESGARANSDDNNVGGDESAENEAAPDDCCELCLMAPREGFALVPCGHARFYDSCAMRDADLAEGCTVCGKKKYPLKLFAIFLATARNFYMKFHTFITHS